jgi:hypothetical protein
MSVDHISWTTSLERKTDIRVLEFADQVYLYERREVTKPLNGKVTEQPTSTFVQGVADWASIEAVKLGRFDDVVPFDPTLGVKPGADYVPMMISEKGLEVIRLEGHPFSDHKVLEKLTQSGDLVRKGGTSFIDLFDKGFSARNVFFASVKDHSIVDLRGKHIVVPYRFSYLDGLSSDNFDLDRVLEIVGSNPEVEIHTQYMSQKSPIPNYDDRDAPTRYGLTLTWRPSRESWDQMMATAAEQGVEVSFGGFRSYELLTKHDVLGIASVKCTQEMEPEDEENSFTL